jgi:hypothetical protein
MENRRVLKRSSIYRKGLYIGSLLTLVVYLLNLLFGRVGEGLNLMRYVTGIPWLALMSPTWALFRVFGIRWNAGGSVYETPWYIVFSMILVNSVIVALICRVLAWAFGSFRSPR